MVDSLQVFEILKSGHIPEAQARAMTQAIQTAEADIGRDLKSVIERQFIDFEARIDGKLTIFEGRLEGRLESRLMGFDGKLDVLESRVSARLAETKSEILRWTFAFWVTQLAAMAAILKLLK